MTIRVRWTAACALLLAVHAPALAQERPPEPQVPLTVPDRPAAPPGRDDRRPPERPYDESADAVQPDAPAPRPESSRRPPEQPEPDAAQGPAPADSGPEDAASNNQPKQPFGPPPPPVWFILAEDDAGFAACRLALSLLGTRYTLEPSVTEDENRDCGIARPLRVTEIVPGVRLTGDPVMRCDTVRALGFWTRDFLRPAAALLPGAPRLQALQTGPAYTCRDRVGTGAADPKPSEHGYGNAIDIMGFQLAGADALTVTPRAGDGDSAEAFLRAARGTACLLFTTVLGPGSNAAHDDHLHLDLAARNGGWRLCE